MKRRTFCLGAILAAVLSLPALAEETRATLYKNPQCSCCEGNAADLRQNGFDVDVRPTNDLAEISQKAGCPGKLARLPHDVCGRLRRRWSRASEM